MYKVLGVVSGVLTVAIVWFSGFDSIKVGMMKIDAVYEQKISFWVIFQSLNIMKMIPVVGSMVSLWQPLILALSMVAGNTTLLFMVKIILKLWKV